MNCKINVHIQMAKLTLRNVAVDVFIAGGILVIMEIKIIKRNGEAIPFDRNKIFNAICKAMDEVGELDTNIAHQIAAELSTYAKLNAQHNVDNTVEDIQDEVENLLMQYNLSEVARAYIRYRYQREVARGYTGDFLKAITEKLTAKNVQNQNANVDEHSFGGRKGEANSVLMKKYALDFCMSKMAKENHLNNEIYIHDLDTYPVGMHNCAARETKFCTTNDGVRSFEDYNDGDRISVLTHLGTHSMATVKKFGVQKLNKITFSFAGQRFVTERFTANHRWYLADGSVTENLKIGDKLFKCPIQIRTNNEFSFDDATDKEKYYWCLGFVLADGTEAYRWSHGKKNEDIKFVRMRLCGDKIKYEPRFSILQHSTKEMENGDLYLTFSSAIVFRKQFPDLSSMTRREKHALFDGLYAADGQHAGSRKSIFTTNEQIASFIEDEAPALGWFILNIKDKTGEITNYVKRGFAKEYTFIGDTNKYYWTVTDIQEDIEEEVWCLQVDDISSFVLPNGITTGNCLSIPFDDLLKNGFNTRQTDVRPAGSVNTAFQLVAVVFQLQSLQQFGGVSATHIDWTMVPYVRKSFYKHFCDGCKYLDKLIIPDDLWKDCVPENYSITDERFKKYPEAYQYAIDMTTKEVHQAVEGMYHNLSIWAA